MRLVKLTGMVNNHFETEEILQRIIKAGASNAAVMSREIQVQCPAQKLQVVKAVLDELMISEVKVKESSIIETTVAQSGSASDPKKSLKVSLAPASRMCGKKMLSVMLSEGYFINDGEVSDYVTRSKNVINQVLEKAGVTDCLISVELRKKTENIDRALELATVGALLETNGMMQIN
ncbi:MAG: hypothetical protein KAI53_05290 [Candidatus Aenigmarchaeota archaeon]|nr:hypothetical protein [Candidatus Aenigmarchaeota archaeon]